MSLRLRAVMLCMFIAAALVASACSGSDDETVTPQPTGSVTATSTGQPDSSTATPTVSATVPSDGTPVATPQTTPVIPTQPTATPTDPNATAQPVTPTPFSTPVVIPPSDNSWPSQLDLSVGESSEFTLQDGSKRTITLVDYELVFPRTKTIATVRVEGGGRSVEHTLQVAHAGVPVAINGAWIYGYAWKEADDDGFESVAKQGSFPLTDGKDVGFAVNDALYPFFPGLDNYTYPIEPPAVFHEGEFLQTWLDPDGWAHSGFDIGTTNNQGIVAMMDGYAWFQYYGGQGAIWVTENNDQWSQSQQCFIFTHILDGSVTVENGAAVNKGDLIADSIFGATNIHAHMGSCNLFDFGAWLFTAEVWNNKHADDFAAPRHWLGLGSYIGDINSNHIAANESGDLPSSLVPQAGDLDRSGQQRWQVIDNFVNSVVRMGEVLSDAPFAGHSDRDPDNSVGYIATHIYSPVDYTGSTKVRLKLGATRGARVWLNGDKIHDATESRYNSYNVRTEPAIVIDKYDYALPLKQGWNTVIIKSDHGARQATLWAVSPKIGDANGNVIPGLIFSTRDTQLSATGGDASVSLSWNAPDFHGTNVESYLIDIATDPAFRNIVVTVDAGTATSRTIESLAGSFNYYARLRPSNPALGGSTYWQHTDSVQFQTTGKDNVAPSQSPPNGLQSSQVPLFVLLGSDDNNRAGGMEFFINAFDGRVNPSGNGNRLTFDGEAAAMSFYIIGANIYGPNINSGNWRDQYMAIYENGHELGNHGFFGLASQGDRGTSSNWLNEWMRPTHEAIERMFIEYGYSANDVDAAIRGYRAAQDVIDPAMYEAIAAMGYDYGNSSTTNNSSNLPPWWPGTLDGGWPGGPTWESRDFGETPGVWEVPQTYAVGANRYCDKDWFLPPANQDGAGWREAMQETFTQLYDGNRAPFSLCLHSQEWGPANLLASGGANELNATLIERQQALNDFLDWMLSGEFEDVRIVTHNQLIQWMRNPIPLREPTIAPTPTPVAQPTATPTLPLSLVYTVNSDRSGIQLLDGQTVSGDIFVFTHPDEGVSRVSFYLDDADRSEEPFRTENVAPFDMFGTNDNNGDSLSFDTADLTNGPHNITAEVTLNNSETRLFSADIIVSN